MKITALYIYPIKSLGGIALNTAEITTTGFAYDRYWMLVDEKGVCVTQRDYPIMALFQLSLSLDSVQVRYEDQAIEIPKVLGTSEQMECTVWGNQVAAIKESQVLSDWFSDILKAQVTLVRKADAPKRRVKNHPDTVVNFSDSNQYLILGEASLAHLNSKLERSIPMNRFRPNIVFSGGQEHIEDSWQSIQINTVIFEVTKACARCSLTTIDQATAAVGLEPMRTLFQYRKFEQAILFGQYLKVVADGDKRIKVGNELQVLGRRA